MSTSQDQARTRTNTIEDDDATTVCTAHDRRREAPLDAVEHDVAEASAAATNAMGVGATSVMTAGATSVMGTGAAPTGGPSPTSELMSGRSPYAAYLGSPDTHIGATQPIAVRKGLFDGISVAQVIAASAAAATSMLLASRIGIAGSVIGAAVSSMITVICSQLYRNALDASAQKLKAKQASSDLAHGTAMSASAVTEPNGTFAAPYAARLEGRDLTARIAPTKLQARAAAERSATKRKVAVVSVVIAVAAVAASAGIIMLTTSGEGLGVKVPSLFASTDQQAVAPEDPADELASSAPTPQDTGAPSTGGQSTNQSGATDGATNAGGQDTTGGGAAGNGQSGTDGPTSNGATGSGDSAAGNGAGSPDAGSDTGTSDGGSANGGTTDAPSTGTGQSGSSTGGKTDTSTNAVANPSA